MTGTVTPYARRVALERGLQVALDEPRTVLSTNEKTGVSINFPVAFTCRPTRVCARICYACRGNSRLNMSPAHAKVLQTYHYFKTTPTDVVSARIAREYAPYTRRLGLHALRWNGVGDLFPESVAVINYMAAHYDIKHYVFSRRVEMMNQLTPDPRVVGLLSIDEDSWAVLDKLTRPYTKIAYLRTSDFIPVMPADAIVFRAHKQWDALPADARDCPCDAHQIPSKLACVTCQRCYTELSNARCKQRKSPACAGNQGRRGGPVVVPQLAA